MLTIEHAANRLAEATRCRDLHDLAHADVKLAALARLVQQENPLTKKPHSASSAEGVLEQDAEYRRSREQRTEFACRVIVAQGDYDAAVANAHTHDKALAANGGF
jgi:hypothetical protein